MPHDFVERTSIVNVWSKKAVRPALLTSVTETVEDLEIDSPTPSQ
jgi:hypothetical protein